MKENVRTLSAERVAVGDIALSVVDEGRGPAIVFLHGFPDSAFMWRYQIAAVADRGFRAIAPDLRGFGNSDRPRGVRAYRMENVVRDLEGLLDALDLERVCLVGHDWGAIAAWAFAGQRPERVERLVAVSVGHPHAYMRAFSQQWRRSWYAGFFLIPALPEAILKANDWRLFRLFLGRYPDTEHDIELLSRPGALTSALNWYRANARPDRLLRRSLYPPVKAPTIGVWGARDWALGEKQMTLSSDYVDSHWRYERLDASHWIPVMDSERLNALLMEFLER